MVEVDTDKQPSEGEVLIFTLGGSFFVKGHDTLQKYLYQKTKRRPMVLGMVVEV